MTIVWPVGWSVPDVKPIKVIYVIGPYRAESAWGIHQNVLKAEAVGLRLWKLGYVPIVPHKLTEFYQGECPDDVWLEGMIELMKRADGVFLVDGWETSEGSKHELKIARELGMPVMGHGEIPEGGL